MAIRIVRATRTDALANALAASLAGGLPDPFRRDLVVVPTRGIERYLAQTIATINGIAANIEFPSPREFLDMLLPDGDDWSAKRLTWPVLSALDANLHEPWCTPVREHLKTTPDWDRRQRRLALASRIARLFAAYTDERPAMVRQWQRSAAPPSDLPPDLAWQFHLWRAVHTDLGHGPLDTPPDPAGLPERIGVFGPTRLPQRFLETLQIVAEERDVDLYLPTASPALWDANGWRAADRRADDTSQTLASHPILRSLGRDARELRQRLPDSGLTLPSDITTDTTVLSLLQSQIERNTESSVASMPPDDSLQIHACHGPLRQVEVLREVILTLLHEHPHLQPRDVLIMASDLDAYAPLLSAVFGDPDPRIADLRLAIADRTKAQSNEVLGALDALMELLQGRMTRSAVLDLLSRPPVRARFGLSEDDAARLAELSESAGVRWGLDDAHRADYGMAGIDQGTWAWGLRRMSLGTAMSDEGFEVFGDTLPLADVGSGDIDLLGRLAEFLHHLGDLMAAVREPRTMAEWNTLLAAAIPQFTATRLTDSWQTEHALGVIESYTAAAGSYADTVPLTLTDIRHALADVLAGRPTRTGFRLGGMTACRMEPMRSVPYKVICLLGLDDGAFPRKSGRDGDDVLLRDPRIGERDPRSEDRQLFLDAVMAATEHLVITYTGRDERINDERQPAVPLAELIDILPPDLVRHHPLQPFDPANFAPAAPFSHDEAALAGALAGNHREPWSFLEAPLPPPDPLPARSLDSLAKFLKVPPSTFLEQRLQLRLRSEETTDPDALPFGLSGLDKYAIGDRLLQPMLQGADAERVARAEGRAGAVPPDALGQKVLGDAGTTAQRILEFYNDFTGGLGPRPVSFTLDLGDGQPITATVPGVCGTTIVAATFSTVKVKEALGIWPYLLALQAAFPADQWASRISAKEGTIELNAPPHSDCIRILRQLFELQEAALCSPTPVSSQAAYAYADARRRDPVATARAAAAKAWSGDRDLEKEAFVVAFGRAAPFERAWSQQPLSGERHPEETNRFAAVSRLIFDPLLDTNPSAGVKAWPKPKKGAA